MTNVIQFPGEQEREWRMWEEEIRKCHKGTEFEDVVEDSLPEVHRHWEAIFENVSLQPVPVSIPGPLSSEQMSAIQETGNAAAAVVIARLKQERIKALTLLMNAEILLAYYRRHGVPPGARR